MNIELKEMTVREVAQGYFDNLEAGCFAFDGKLNVRPPYQREFIYKEDKRNKVIDTIQKGFPLNVMYWSKNADGTFEMLDGQQRTISFCQYVNNEFSLDNFKFSNLSETKREEILNYKLTIYVCEGNDQERLDWFETINIAGEKLTDQELRNAVYTGKWLADAKLKFSKKGCAAYELASKYIVGSPERQDYLQAAISWISGGKIREYMAEHQHDPNANELWRHFRDVVDWVDLTFRKYRKELKGINWGALFDKYKDVYFDTVELEGWIECFMLDDEITNKRGIYFYVLSKDEKYLNLRAFSEAQRRQQYEKQRGVCRVCNKHFEFEEMEADHITPWIEGGKTVMSNCQMLCRECNRRKSDR